MVDAYRHDDPSKHHPPSAGVSGQQSDDHALWREFAEATTAEVFYRSWLAIQCRTIPGVACGIFVAEVPGEGRFAPAAFWPEARVNVKHLAEVAERALTERRGIIFKRTFGGQGGGAPRERFDVAYPIQANGKLHVVALELGPRPESELQSVLRDLQRGAAWLEVFPSRQAAGERTAIATRLQAVVELLASALAEQRFFASATAFVTAIAARLGCERVSVGFVSRGRAHVRAVSHSAQFGKQTNLVRAIGAAMDETLDQQASVVHPAPPHAPARVTRAHEELARQHGAGAVCTIPFAEGSRWAGALTLERPAEHPFDKETVELCEALASLAGPVLEVKRRDDRWLPSKALDSGRQLLSRLVGPHHVTFKLTAVGLAAAIALAIFATGDYRVSARAVLEAGVRQAIVAPFNGYIKDANVRAGDLVRRGQVLCTLEDRELRLERLKGIAQQEQLVKQQNQALAARNAAQVNIAAAQIDQVRAQLALLDEQLARTRVVATFDGIVVTGDLSQALGSPVERGQVLYEISPLSAYRLVLQVDEREIGDVEIGQRGSLVVAAAPSARLGFTIEKITPVSTAREGRNYFRVEATLDRIPDYLRPGLEGVGKIEIDRRSLVWIWTRPVVDWARLTLWTWLP